MALVVTSAAPHASEHQPLQAGKLAISTPKRVATLDPVALQGSPVRLAWSPDGSMLYLQTMEGTFGLSDTWHAHYIYSVLDGSSFAVPDEPDWAADYWLIKSDRAMPGEDVMIGLETEQRIETTTSSPMGGDLARGGTVGSTGAQMEDAVNAALTRQQVNVHIMSLHGQRIGEFVNSVIVPGLTYGWAPQGMDAIAYAAPRDGKIYVLDNRRKKQEVDGSKDGMLPAWSADGGRLAWIQKDGRGLVLMVANLSTT
jgi:dipeptidyl aminopeptidase/acylaminoacyl peptidase